MRLLIIIYIFSLCLGKAEEVERSKILDAQIFYFSYSTKEKKFILDRLYSGSKELAKTRLRILNQFRAKRVAESPVEGFTGILFIRSGVIKRSDQTSRKIYKILGEDKVGKSGSRTVIKPIFFDKIMIGADEFFFKKK